MGARLSEVSPLRSLGCLLAAVAALQIAACGGKSGSVPEPSQAGAPRLALERVPGTYVGSMLTASGVEAVVLEIREVAPARDGFAFRYRLRTRGTGEDGMGTMRVQAETTQVCFDSSVCGWLLAEDDQIRIASDLRPGQFLPVWALEKL